MAALPIGHIYPACFIDIFHPPPHTKSMMMTELVFSFLLGGWGYVGLEILWRRHSHWTMFIPGGLCFSLIYALSTRTALPLPLQCALSALIITGVEFLVGCVVNLALGWNVWDYSGLRYHLLGQVSLPFSALWLALSYPALLLARLINTHLFPHPR
jgi:uncharacterized membrane protein